MDRRIIVLRPGDIAAAAVFRAGGHDHAKKASDMIAGHGAFLYVAAGEGTYRANGREGSLRPGSLLAVPAGAFSCELSEDGELYALAVRDSSTVPDDPKIFTPFVDRKLFGAEARFVRDRIEDAAERVASGRFGAEDVANLKRSFAPLTLEKLARDVGYTANYLNDLSREYTGRALGGWITDMRMARARVALEHTDSPIADIGAASGYDDPAYFSRAFRRAHGVPPATWRIASRPVASRYADVTIPIDVLHEMETARIPLRSYSFAS